MKPRRGDTVSTRPLGLASLAAFIVIIAVALIFRAVGVVTTTEEVLSLTVAFSGVWTMILGGIRAKFPGEYERGALSTFGWGFLLTAIGASWFLYIRFPQTFTPLLVAAVILIAIAILAVIAAVRMGRKQPS